MKGKKLEDEKIEGDELFFT